MTFYEVHVKNIPPPYSYSKKGLELLSLKKVNKPPQKSLIRFVHIVQNCQFVL